MQIVVNHITRMEPGYVCIAGLEPETGRHVRPVLQGARLTEQVLRRNGGPFDMAMLVDLGDTQPAGEPPETEDHIIAPHRARTATDVEPAEFWTLLRRVALPTLAEIFGDDLRPQGQTYAVDLRKGSASLGCVAPARLSLYVDGRGTIRLALDDSSMQPILPVTDLRFYQSDFRTLRRDAVRDYADRLRRGVPAILSVGLTRSWQRPGDTAFRHWLQVNNIHLEDDPAWRGAP